VIVTFASQPSLSLVACLMSTTPSPHVFSPYLTPIICHIHLMTHVFKFKFASFLSVLLSEDSVGDAPKRRQLSTPASLKLMRSRVSAREEGQIQYRSKNSSSRQQEIKSMMVKGESLIETEKLKKKTKNVDLEAMSSRLKEQQKRKITDHLQT